MRKLLTRLLWWAAVACAPLCGQAPAPGQAPARFELANGAVVQYQPWDGYARPRARPDGLQLLSSVIRRTIRDGQDRLILAFDVHVDTNGKSPLRLSFTPIPGAPFFAQAPVPRDLQPGNHVLVDVMEQAATGKKMFDSLCVGFRATPMRLPMLPDAPSTIPPGAVLHLDHAQLKENGALIAKNSGTQSGTRLRLAFPNGGEYTLSSDPGPDYRLEAVVYGSGARTVAVFPDGERLYGLVCSSSIVDQPGGWLLWVRKDVTPTAGPRRAAPPGIPPDQFNAALKVIGLPPAEPNPGPPSSLPELKIWAVR